MKKNRLKEFYGYKIEGKRNWKKIVEIQKCPFIGKKCIKSRKSHPDETIGACTVSYGKESLPLVICPHRFVKTSQIFLDCLHLLRLHEPGNELHVIPEVSIPGGNVDYFLVSVKNGEIADFVGIELQALDTTGTVWPQRELALQELKIEKKREIKLKPYGVNWKMTAKTILVQLHHKVETFEHINKHLVLVFQDDLFSYMKREFNFSHLRQAKNDDSMHFHAYILSTSKKGNGELKLMLKERASTDSIGVASCLGLMSDPKVEYKNILKNIKKKINKSTLLKLS